MWVSWNGATEVARREVLAGASADALAATRAVASHGLRTATSVPALPRQVAVRRLDAEGRELGRSRVLDVGSGSARA